MLAFEMQIFRYNSICSWYFCIIKLLFKIIINSVRCRAFNIKITFNEGSTADAIYNYFEEQFNYAEIPTADRIIAENLHFEGKHYLIFHSCFGRRVNDVLSRSLAYVYSKIYHTNIMVSITDHNFYLQSTQKLSAAEGIEQLKKENLQKLMELAVDKTDILKRRFRHCAGRSLMILRNYKGHRKAVGRQQVFCDLCNFLKSLNFC